MSLRESLEQLSAYLVPTPRFAREDVHTKKEHLEAIFCVE